jgi:drug/metabolite transporter (DMT)-like permease
VLSRGNATSVGIAWMLVATVQWTGMDTLNKYLTLDYPLAQIVFMRFVVHILIVVAVWAPRLPEFLFRASWRLQLTRSAFMVAGTGIVIIAFDALPLLLVNAIGQMTPVLVTAISVPMLKEKVGWRRWLGVLAGFAGAMIVIGPASFTLSLLVLVPLGSAVTGAFYQITTRQLGGRDSVETTLFHTALVGSAVALVAWTAAAGGLIPVETVWKTPDTMGWVWLLALGALGVSSHYCMILAFTAAPASVVAPFGYAGLVWTAVAGVIVFAEIPSLSTVAGGAIIAGSGLYIFYREKKRGRPVAASA